MRPSDKSAFSVEEFGQLYGLCRATIYKEIAGGSLTTFKVGRRRLISASAAIEWVVQKEAANQS